MPQFILILSCPDKAGIVAAVSEFLLAQNMNINESDQFGAPETNCFFMRLAFSPLATPPALADIEKAFAPIGEKFAMDWHIYDAAAKPKTLILVSKFDHCLVDLLYRTRIGALNIDIQAVVSNHDTARHVVEREGLAFHHHPIAAKDKTSKKESEQKLHALIKETGAELIVLARYMQVLSAVFCEQYAGQIINIHHSFLPGFKGAAPYSQAFERGVKMIGATAHYVTSALDEGPIISQNTAAVRHDMSVEKMVSVGREVEQQVLAHAVALHCERRVLLNGHKTVVFSH